MFSKDFFLWLSLFCVYGLEIAECLKIKTGSQKLKFIWWRWNQIPSYSGWNNKFVSLICQNLWGEVPFSPALYIIQTVPAWWKNFVIKKRLDHCFFFEFFKVTKYLLTNYATSSRANSFEHHSWVHSQNLSEACVPIIENKELNWRVQPSENDLSSSNNF